MVFYFKMSFLARSSLVWLVLAVFPMNTALALTVDDLYVAEVLVTDESDGQRRSGARAGLLQVLVRVSGDPGVEDSTLIGSALRNPEEYYYQFSYESTDKVLMLDGEEVAAQTLRLNFEPSAVSRLLRRGGFQVWGSNRPAVLVWLAVNDGQGRRLLGGADEGPLNTLLDEQSRLRGVPVLFPLLDLEDSAALSTAEVWGAFLGRIRDASQRYNPDVILTARIQQDPISGWSAKWAWYIEGEWQVEDTVSPSMELLVRDKVDLLASELADRYAIDSSRGQVALRVEAVDSLQDYADVSRYVESLAPVVDSSVIRVEGDEVEFRLNTEGQADQLVRVIELDEKMVLINSDDALHYRWLAP